MAYFTPKCGGIKLSTASMKQIGKVITDVNATSIGDTLVTSCGQLFDGAYFTKVGKTIALAGTTTITGKQVANCCLPFDSGSFAVDEDGAIEYNPDIVSLLTITVSPEDATILVVDSNDMPVEDSGSGVYPVLIGKTYTYTVTADGYVTQSADIEVDKAVEEVDLTLAMPELTVNVAPSDAIILVTDENDMPVEEQASGSYYVLMGRTYTVTGTAEGYISASVEVEIDEAVEEVDLTLTMPELTINVTNTDVTAAITVVDDEAVAVQPNEDGSYYVLMGQIYTWTVTADGYNTETAAVEIDEAQQVVTVTLTSSTAP